MHKTLGYLLPLTAPVACDPFLRAGYNDHTTCYFLGQKGSEMQGMGITKLGGNGHSISKAKAKQYRTFKSEFLMINDLNIHII